MKLHVHFELSTFLKTSLGGSKFFPSAAAPPPPEPPPDGPLFACLVTLVVFAYDLQGAFPLLIAVLCNNPTKWLNFTKY